MQRQAEPESNLFETEHMVCWASPRPKLVDFCLVYSNSHILSAFHCLGCSCLASARTLVLTAD